MPISNTENLNLIKQSAKDFESAMVYTSVTEYPINFEYLIDLPYNVESNGKACIIQVKEYEKMQGQDTD